MEDLACYVRTVGAGILGPRIFGLSMRLKNQNGSFGLASDMLNLDVMCFTRSTRGMIRNNLHHEVDTEAHSNLDDKMSAKKPQDSSS